MSYLCCLYNLSLNVYPIFRKEATQYQGKGTDLGIRHLGSDFSSTKMNYVTEGGWGALFSKSKFPQSVKPEC